MNQTIAKAIDEGKAASIRFRKNRYDKLVIHRTLKDAFTTRPPAMDGFPFIHLSLS